MPLVRRQRMMKIKDGVAMILGSQRIMEAPRRINGLRLFSEESHSESCMMQKMRKLGIAICSLLPALVTAVPFNLGAAIIFTSTLNGVNEVPPNASPGIGSAKVTLLGDTLTVNETFSGLTAAAAAAAHIHCCAAPGANAPVAVPFPGFPSATSGVYTHSFDLTQSATYNPAFLTANGATASAAEATLIAGLKAGLTYANIHNSNFPGGEIRGQLQAIPEPATSALMILGLTSLALTARCRKHP